jgi:hypothetical protein
VNLTGPDSQAVNGQLLSFPTSASYTPTSYGPQTVGVPNVTPSYPPFLGGAVQSAPGAESVGGYGTAGQNQMATAYAANNPWSLKASPVLWAVGGLVLSLICLKAVHWRETLIEGSESGSAGPAHEEASAGV